MTPEWTSILHVDARKQKLTGIPAQKLMETGRLISTLPKESNFHKAITRIFE